MASSRYTHTVGKKFYADGRVRPHPGSTVICFGDHASEFYAAGQWLQQQFAELPLAAKYTMLPVSSFHMTVFSLIIHDSRDPAYWPPALPLTATLEEADQFFIERVLPVRTPADFEMRFQTLGSDDGLAIIIAPANSITYDALWSYRQRLVEATGIRYPDHADYAFHISLAYKIVELTPEEEHQRLAFLQTSAEHLRRTLPIFNSRAPQLAFFDDMFAFVRTDARRTLPLRAGTSSV